MQENLHTRGSSSPSLAVSAFELDLVSCTPLGGRETILARLQFRAPGQYFEVAYTGRGYVRGLPPALAAEMREPIEAEATRIVALALREAMVRGERAKGMLRRLERKAFRREAAA